ncbi:MAG: hypothetical protein M3R41_07905, partial [Pseudomonadota bacterium]|nr:hypothetical protein [Pseudomonadota bacterium]
MSNVQSGKRGGKPLVEDCLTLDLAWLMRLGPISGKAGGGEIHWYADGVPARSVRFQLNLRAIENAHLTVASETINQTIALVALPQHFGGLRWWFLCPVTGARARTLHLPPDGLR